MTESDNERLRTFRDHAMAHPDRPTALRRLIDPWGGSADEKAPPVIAGYLPYQARVVDERSALVVRLQALQSFIGSPAMRSLAVAEQARLLKQGHLMAEYALVLTERIEAFGP